MNKKGRIYRTLAAAKHAFFENPEQPPTDENKPEEKVLPTKVEDPVTVADLKSENCTGCGACYAVCPQNAIEMKKSSEGFLSPVIDHSKCIECKICAKTCPAMNECKDKNTETPECFAVKADDDIRMKSSSGGVFTLLANNVFSRGGVVCGAAFTDDFHVEHIIIRSPEQMYKLRGSKYVQSSCHGVFRELKKLLDDGTPVLFSGCPCQVAGLKAFLKKHYKNLITMDIVCHGVPSPAAFEKYLEETCDISDIKEFRFRIKSAGYNCLNLEIIYKDGTSQLRCIETDPYEQCFHGSVMLRESCYNCKFAELPRRGDITAGDFWGISQFDNTINDGKGVSLMLVNNKKTKALLENINTSAQSVQPAPLEVALRNNRFGAKIGLNVNKRRNFFDLLSRQSFLKAAEYSTKDKYDVGIMGVWYGCNYGSVATYFTLHEIISEMGLSVLMIDKPNVYKDDPENEMTHSRRFAAEHYKMSRRYDLHELGQLNRNVDTFVMGCDQVWNRGISLNFGMANYFDFVDDDKKKISYASSFGHSKDNANERDRVVIKQYFDRFDSISVREADGVKICEEVYGVNAKQVIDPVFLYDKTKYAQLYNKSAAAKRTDLPEKYICTYILDPTQEIKDAIAWVSEKTGMKVINMLDGFPWRFDINVEKMAGCTGEIAEDVQVEDWLYYIANCDFLITDSCHGTSFAIIFEKLFICIGNKERGLSRFESLLGMFDLMDRVFLDPKEIINNDKVFEPIDFGRLNDIIEREKKSSLEWLKNALFSPKKYRSHRAYAVYDERMEDKK